MQELRVPLDTVAVPEPLLNEVYEEVLEHDQDQRQETDQYNLDKHADHKGNQILSKTKFRAQNCPCVLL